MRGEWAARSGCRPFFLLEGELTVRVGDPVFTASPGSFVFCPREVPHLLTADSAEVTGPEMLALASRP